MRAYRALFVAVIVLTTCFLASSPASAEIVGRYTFDDSADLFDDSSALNNDGSVRGSDPAQNTTTVKVGTGSLDLDGNDSVNIDALADDVTTTAHTIALWVNSAKSGGQQTLVAANSSTGGNGMLVFAEDNVLDVHSAPPELHVGVGSTQIVGEETPQWHHVVYTRDGSVGNIYVDGVSDDDPFTSSYILSAVDQWSIGQEFDGTSRSDHYTGQIDDVQIYDAALSASQVQYLFDNPGSVAPMYWDTNDATPGAGGSTPGGNWTDTTWSSDSTGSTATGAWVPGSVAVFSAGDDATGTFTVNVSGTQQIGGLDFEQGMVTLQGGTLEFTGGATFTKQGSASTATISSSIQGNGQLLLDGVGAWGWLSGAISDSGGVASVKIANGASYVFSANSGGYGNNTYSGDTILDGGYIVPLYSSVGSATTGDLSRGPFGTGTLVLNGGSLRPTSSRHITIGNAVTLSGNMSLGNNDSSQHLTFSGPITLAGTYSLNCNSSTIYLNGVVGDGGSGYGLTKAGSSILVLSGANTYSGYTRITQGTLMLKNALALQNSTLNLDGADSGMLTFGTPTAYTLGGLTGSRDLDMSGNTLSIGNNNKSTSYSGELSNGSLTKIGSGTLTLSGSTANTYTGLTTVNGGTLRLSKSSGVNAVAGDIVVDSGMLHLATTHQIADTSSITVNGSAHFDNGEKADTVANVTLASTHSDPNTNRVSNMNITDTLTISAGVVGLNSNTNTTANTLDMSGGSRMDFAANTGSTTLNIGSGGLTMSGANLRLGWSGLDSPYTARVNLDGDFTGSGSNSISYVTTSADRWLDLLGATRTFNITDGTTTIQATVRNGDVTKTGAGTLTYSGATNNDYTGLTTVSDGVLRLAKSSGFTAIAGNILIDGGELNWGASHQLADSSSITVDNGRLYANTSETLANVTLNCTTSGGYHLINGLNITDTLGMSAGDVVVGSGGSATANAVNMTGGRLAVAANGGNSTLTIGSGGLTMSDATVTLGYDGAGYTARINLAGDFEGSGTNSIVAPNASGPRQLDLQGANRTFDIIDGTTTVNATIQNGGLIKDGDGTLTLLGDNTYTGTTTVSDGTLLVNGTHTGAGTYTVQDGGTLGGTGTIDALIDVELGGTLAPGASVGQINLGELSMAEGSLLELEFNSLSDFDFVNVEGAAHLDCTLELVIGSGFSPGVGDTFDVLAAGDGITFTPGYGAESAELTSSGIRFHSEIVYDAGTGISTLRLQLVPEPATLLVWSLLAGLGVGLRWRRRK